MVSVVLSLGLPCTGGVSRLVHGYIPVLVKNFPCRLTKARACLMSFGCSDFPPHTEAQAPGRGQSSGLLGQQNHTQNNTDCQAPRNGSIAWQHLTRYCEHVSYTMNPFLPKLRADAVNAVHDGQAIRAVAHHLGVAHSTVVRPGPASTTRGLCACLSGCVKPKTLRARLLSDCPVNGFVDQMVCFFVQLARNVLERHVADFRLQIPCLHEQRCQLLVLHFVPAGHLLDKKFAI